MTTSKPVVVELDTSVYRLNAIKKAAYRFGGKCHVGITPAASGRVLVSLDPKGNQDDSASLAGEFQNEVMDQELREVIASETEGVRNLLLAQAFSAISLIDPAGEDADFRDDPAEIAKSDAQKNLAGQPKTDGACMPTTQVPATA